MYLERTSDPVAKLPPESQDRFCAMRADGVDGDMRSLLEHLGSTPSMGSSSSSRAGASSAAHSEPFRDVAKINADPMSRQWTGSLDVRRVVRAARGAVDYQIVDLPSIGMHQDSVTHRASKIDRMRAGDQYRRGPHDVTDAGLPDKFQYDAISRKFRRRDHGSALSGSACRVRRQLGPAHPERCARISMIICAKLNTREGS